MQCFPLSSCHNESEQMTGAEIESKVRCHADSTMYDFYQTEHGFVVLNHCCFFLKFSLQIDVFRCSIGKTNECALFYHGIDLIDFQFEIVQIHFNKLTAIVSIWKSNINFGEWTVNYLFTWPSALWRLIYKYSILIAFDLCENGKHKVFKRFN